MTLKDTGLFGLFFILSIVSYSSNAHATTIPLTPPQPIENSLPIKKVYVLGQDSRTTTIPYKYRQLSNSIGRFIKPGSVGCSAFCVAPDVIATAAHCAMGAPKGQKRNYLKSIYFLRYDSNNPRRNRVSKANGFNDIVPRNMVAGVSVDRRFRVARRNLKAARRDWALVKLRSPICQNHVVKVKKLTVKQAVKASKKWQLFQLAYHGDVTKMKELVYTPSCRFFSLNSRNRKLPAILRHSCDTGKGSSGSPIFMETKNGAVVVAINVGGVARTRFKRRGRKVIKRYKAVASYNTSVNSRVFADKIKQLANTKIIFNEKKLLLVQSKLKEKRFYRSKVDGVYGPALRAAIRSYQQKTRMTIDGFPSENLLSKLFDGKSYAAAMLEIQSAQSLRDTQRASVITQRNKARIAAGNQKRENAYSSSNSEFRRRALALARRNRAQQRARVDPQLEVQRRVKRIAKRNKLQQRARSKSSLEFRKRAAALARRQRDYLEAIKPDTTRKRQYRTPKVFRAIDKRTYLSEIAEIYFLSTYKPKRNRKAFAIGPHSVYGSTWGHKTQRAANAKAIKVCQSRFKRSKNKKIRKMRCTLYAKGNRIVYQRKHLKNPIGSILPNPDKPLINAVFSGGANDNPKAVLLFLHGCNQFKYGRNWLNWLKVFFAMDLHVIAPDSFADKRPSEKCGRVSRKFWRDRTIVRKLRIAQTLRTIKNLKKTYPKLPIFIWGHSEGGAIAQWLNVEVSGIIASGVMCGTFHKKYMLTRKSTHLLVLSGTKDIFLKPKGGRNYENLKRTCDKALTSKNWSYLIMKGQRHTLTTKNKTAVAAMKNFINSRIKTLTK